MTSWAKLADLQPARPEPAVVHVQTTRTMERGVVAAYHPDRHYGFITPDAGGPDIFIHSRTVAMSRLPTLTPGDRVEYERVRDNVGFQAYRVRLI